MNFTAPAFVLLFPIVLALHWMLPPSRRWVLLLAASLGFYAVGSPQALPLLAGITLGTYAAALGIAKSKTQTAKKLWLTCAAVLCIGCLCLFKYAGIFRTDVPLLLPAGISFYTFQTLSYVIDIYRGRLMPERHPGYYALFVSFFPQLVAGPIERSTALLPQLHAQERRMDSSGWLWMVRGFAKKLLLADTAAVFVDSVYASPADASGPAVLLATLLFAGQIYWDFSGYSDIAVGAAALLGVRLSRNFDHPYRADSLRDFWRRWHISLGDWLRNYLFYPLSISKAFLNWGRHARQHLGNHIGKVLPTAVASLITFLIIGIWHGASWKYVAFGFWNGMVILVSTLLQPVSDKVVAALHIERKSAWYQVFSMLRTFVVVLIGYYFDIADGFRAAMGMMLKSVTDLHLSQLRPGAVLEALPLTRYDWAVLLFGTLVIFVASVIQERSQRTIREILDEKCLALRWAVLLAGIFAVVLMGVYGPGVQASEFVYMQF